MKAYQRLINQYYVPAFYAFDDDDEDEDDMDDDE